MVLIFQNMVTVLKRIFKNKKLRILKMRLSYLNNLSISDYDLNGGCVHTLFAMRKVVPMIF